MFALIDEARSRYWGVRARMSRKLELWKSQGRHDTARVCPICGWRGDAFLPDESESDVMCPVCWARPRHRLLQLVLDELDIPARGGRVLHVSPKGEEGLEKRFRKRASHYLSIDKGGVWNAFSAGGAMREMDLRKLDLPDASFDFVCCNHVLENIVEDEVAIREIHRVLAPGGAAALIVQIYPGSTEYMETPTREDYFHTWHPGMDYFDRYRNAGFSVVLHEAARHDRTLYGLASNGIVPICGKPHHA